MMNKSLSEIKIKNGVIVAPGDTVWKLDYGADGSVLIEELEVVKKEVLQNTVRIKRKSDQKEFIVYGEYLFVDPTITIKETFDQFNLAIEDLTKRTTSLKALLKKEGFKEILLDEEI